jgi:hypothetical protein
MSLSHRNIKLLAINEDRLSLPLRKAKKDSHFCGEAFRCTESVAQIRLLCSRSSQVLYCPLASYKLKACLTFTHLIHHTNPRPTMSPPPNEVFSAFSFIGFVFCAIPFYWHLEGMWNYSHDLSTPKNARLSLEYGHLLVHDLGRAWMSNTMHQLDRVEQEYDQQDSCLLRYQ